VARMSAKSPTDSATMSPAEAAAALAARLEAVGIETVPLSEAAGRVTAEAIVADRPSPPADVSAMDGYAVRLGDLAQGRLPVVARVLPGAPAPAVGGGGAVQIMTGAVVPEGAEAVIKREDVDESGGDHIVIHDGVAPRPGENIRRAGENIEQGGRVVEAGRVIDPPTVAALASFGYAQVQVRLRVRVAFVTTGDELLPPDSDAAPHQIRDSNGPALRAMLSTTPWLELTHRVHAIDEYETLKAALGVALGAADAVFVTGGVSAGTHDFVPRALAELGCTQVFHKLPLRPGRPVLGAVGPQGQAVLGLPGNPQSVMTTARRLGAVALRRRAGIDVIDPPRPMVTIGEHDGRTLHLWWYRPVTLRGAGAAVLSDSRGSGDVVATARSDGFVEVPPNRDEPGPWPFYRWTLES